MTKIDAAAETATAANLHGKCYWRCFTVLKSYNRFRIIIPTWPNLNYQDTATQPPCSLQADCSVAGGEEGEPGQDGKVVSLEGGRQDQ